MLCAKKGVNQKEFSADLGIAEGKASALFNNKAVAIKFETLVDIAKYFGKEVSEVFREGEE